MSEEHETESVTDVEVVEPRVTSESARKLAVRRKIEDAQEAKRLREEFGEDF